MATQVYLEKRLLNKRKRNGTRAHRWSLRWQDPATGKWRSESTGTADRTEADELRRLRWREINGLVEPAVETDQAPVPASPSWAECAEALERAMTADNLRPSYVANALLMFELLRRTFSVASPADVTPAMANEYKRIRAELGRSPWTIKGDLATLKAIYGKWLVRECGLLQDNPFSHVKPPKCDDPEVRIVTTAESAALFAWLAARWNNWRLPAIYLEVAALLGWRATEIASIRESDILPDGYVRVAAATSKTRKLKYGWLPPELHRSLRECVADDWAFGRFSNELRRRMILWRRSPHHAARVKDFSPERLVGWMQDELQRFHEDRQTAENKAAKEAGREPVQVETFTLHDFRRTAITGMQMAGVSEKEASVMVGATPEVIRRHYEKLDGMAIARRNVERRLEDRPHSLRVSCAGPENDTVDSGTNAAQTASA